MKGGLMKNIILVLGLTIGLWAKCLSDSDITIPKSINKTRAWKSISSGEDVMVYPRGNRSFYVWFGDTPPTTQKGIYSTGWVKGGKDTTFWVSTLEKEDVTLDVVRCD